MTFVPFYYWLEDEGETVVVRGCSDSEPMEVGMCLCNDAVQGHTDCVRIVQIAAVLPDAMRAIKDFDTRLTYLYRNAIGFLDEFNRLRSQAIVEVANGGNDTLAEESKSFHEESNSYLNTYLGRSEARLDLNALQMINTLVYLQRSGPLPAPQTVYIHCGDAELRSIFVELIKDRHELEFIKELDGR
jgi:hypothetical protein